jgi:hypothetical protein
MCRPTLGLVALQVGVQRDAREDEHQATDAVEMIVSRRRRRSSSRWRSASKGDVENAREQLEKGVAPAVSGGGARLRRAAPRPRA